MVSLPTPIEKRLPRLRSVGISIKGMSSVGDDPRSLPMPWRTQWKERASLWCPAVLVPRKMTKQRQRLRDFLAVPLKSDPEQLTRIEERFRRWGRPMAASNTKQALFPTGAMPIPNDYGTHPGS